MAVGALYTYQTTSIIEWLCEALKRISSLAARVDGAPKRVSDIINHKYLICSPIAPLNHAM